MTPLELFVRESNWIEGIKRDPTTEEIGAHIAFLSAQRVDIPLFQRFVSIVQPRAVLRDRPGLDVRVGDHIAPRGGLQIAGMFDRIITAISATAPPPSAFDIHRQYLTLHPFTDGNGRSARVLWLRMMGGPEAVPLGFLHTWYYQSLDAGDRT